MKNRLLQKLILKVHHLEDVEKRIGKSNRLFEQAFLRIRPHSVASFLKKIMNVERTTIDTDAGRFHIDPASYFGALLSQTGEYEPDMHQALAHFLGPTDTFIDVGANEGYFSVIGADLVGASGQVLAVEPQKRVQDTLMTNLTLNDAEHVRLIDAAISDTHGEATMHVYHDTNTGSTSLSSFASHDLPTDTVTTMSLSHLFARTDVEQANLLKMDIEGYEYEAILGSPELFEAQRISALALESHPHRMRERGRNPDDIPHFLKHCGYRPAPSFENSVWVTEASTQ